MSSWNDVLGDLIEDESFDVDKELDLWILLGARSGVYAKGIELVSNSGMDLAVRALSHVVVPTDDRLSRASQKFLRSIAVHSSDDEIAAWVRSVRETLTEDENRAHQEELLLSLRSDLTAASERVLVIGAPGSGKTQFLVELLAARLSPDESLTAAAQLASHHPDLEYEAVPLIRSLLATVAVRDRLLNELAGHPRHLLAAEDISDSLLRQARIAGEASASIWEFPMLRPSAAAISLGVRSTNRERVRTYRERSWLLGLRKGSGYIYPEFQFDPETRDVFEEVRQVNEMLDALEDPWGVASWWMTPNSRLDARPVELVGSSRSEEVVRAAEALLEPVG